MGIRFYIPLPGPFAYVPGKKHPKPRSNESTTAASANIASKFIVNRGQSIYDNAHQYAVAHNIDDPDFFASSALNQASTNWKAYHAVGLVLTLIFWFYQMQFGTLILILVPLVNIVAIGIPTVLIGSAICAYLHRGNTLNEQIAQRIAAGER